MSQYFMQIAWGYWREAVGSNLLQGKGSQGQHTEGELYLVSAAWGFWKAGCGGAAGAGCGSEGLHKAATHRCKAAVS